MLIELRRLLGPVPFVITAGLFTVAPASAATSQSSVTGQLSTINDTPFPASTVIAGASWTTGRYGPPSNQFGDILSTSSLDGDSEYVLINDGGTGTQQPARWRNSLARVTGTPGDLEFVNVGEPGTAQTYAAVDSDENRLTGVLGSYYANGFTIARGVFYATQVNNWDWNDNAPFDGLAGIAYSTDQGKHWVSPKRPFPGPTGNLNFIQYGDDATAPDGYVYAIATEREFNASTLILGRAKADIADITNPSRWQWSAGTHWTHSIAQAQPVLEWANHITYPRMSYDAALHRYLLTFTYSYSNTTPGVWKNGSELVVLESSSPRGPFYFVADQADFGPSNGYDPAFPVNWIGSDGTDLWMIWAANFDGCSAELDCSGAYGFNYAELHLVLTKGVARYEQRTPRRRPPVRVFAALPVSARARWPDEQPDLTT